LESVLNASSARSLVAKVFFRFRQVLCPAVLAAIAATAALKEPKADTTTSQLLDGSLVGYPRLEVRGMTVYDPGVAFHYAKSHVVHSGRPATAANVLNDLVQMYREDGYFLARIRFVPGPERGSATVEVFEGVIGRVEIVGVDDRIGRKIADYLEPVLQGTPVRLQEFERALTLAGDLSGVQVRSEFRSPEGDSSGPVDLTIHATNRRSAGSITIDSPPASQSVTVTLAQEFYSTFLAGDMVRGLLGGATDFQQSNGGTVGGYYRAPIGANGAYGETYVGNSRYGRSLSASLFDNFQQGFQAIGAVGYPLIRDIHQYFYALVENDYNELRSYLTSTGTDISNALRLTGFYSSVGSSGFETKIAGTFSAGWSSGTNVGTTVDYQFWSARVGIGSGVPLNWLANGLGLRFEASGQYTSSSLPSAEKYYLGDRERNRGYPIAFLNGDSGLSASFDISKHFNIGHRLVQGIMPYAFAGVGYVDTNNASSTPTPSQALASAGVGAQAYLAYGVNLSGWFGVPLVTAIHGQTYGPTAYVRLTKFW
jgi:hemolysin activation/secretion protein